MGLVFDFDDCGDVTILAGGCISRRFSSFIFSSTSRMMMFGDGEGRGEGIRDDFKDGGGGDLERALGVFCLLFCFFNLFLKSLFFAIGLVFGLNVGTLFSFVFNFPIFILFFFLLFICFAFLLRYNPRFWLEDTGTRS